MPRELIDALGDLLTEYLGMVARIEADFSPGAKGIYSVKELRVMTMVFRCWRLNRPCTVTVLAQETGISKTTVSRAVTTLMTSGLLKEEHDPEDGRKRMLLPTDNGLQTLDNVKAWLGSWAERMHEISMSAELTLPEPRPGDDDAGQEPADALSR